MANIIIKNNIRKVVKEIDENGSVGNVSEDVSPALEQIARDILKKGIERAKKNQRRTLFARDL